MATSPALAETARIRARAELDQLAQRLQAALALSEADARAWRRALTPLLERAAQGFWPVEARLLYDLQKVCIDHERQVYAVDLVEWVLSWGQRPIQRPLPHEQEVLITRHLRSAAHRLNAARVPETSRRALAGLLQAAIQRSEELLRVRFRPALTAVLDEVGLRPQNFPERLARRKLMEELLDQVTERGFLTMGDLRDAMSRNNLKMPDLARLTDFFRGDRLLQSNRRLALVFDGVYRRGEIYLRWLQRLSAAAFATPVGRFLTFYLVLPFGGAFVALKGVEEIINIVGAFAGVKVHLANRYAIADLGVFLFALLYVAPFRRVVLAGLGLLYHAGRALFVDLPVFLRQWPPLRGLIESRPFLVFRRYLFQPLLLTALASLALVLAGIDRHLCIWLSTATFAVAYLLLNSGLGRRLEEAVVDGTVHLAHRLLGDVIPGVIRFLLYMFKRFLEDVERLLYTVDEWLRFKQGESRLTLTTKAVLSVVWFAVTYVVRIYINLMIEPTVNPVKHFPVVTVAAKIITPMAVEITPALVASLAFLLPKVVAYPLVVINLSLIPGVFGFLVWELKENWRLYEANRPRNLQPVILGHHGETMIRLLKPGIHSGTLPKLYARLRRGERRAQQTGDWRSVRRQHHTLHEVEEGIRHFVARDFLPLFEDSPGWKGLGLELSEVCTGLNRIELRLDCPDLSPDSLAMAFELQGGWLVGSIAQPAWLAQLSPAQTQVFRAALVGLYKMAGVHLSRQQIETRLGVEPPSYQITREGLVVWPDAGCTELVYDLREGATIRPRVVEGSAPGRLPAVEAERLVFGSVPLPWQTWVETWSADRAAASQKGPLLEGVYLLPAVAAPYRP